MPILDLHAACSRMDAPLTPRLTAGSCLTQLCRAEEVRQHQPGLTVPPTGAQQQLYGGTSGCYGAGCQSKSFFVQLLL